MQDVRSDLAAPGNILLALVQLLHLFILFLPFALVKAGLENFHSQILIAVLRFFLLALHHDSGRQMGDAYRAAGFVDMLAAGTAGPENINSQIFVIYVDNNFVVQFRIDKDRCKGCMPFTAGVKG